MSSHEQVQQTLYMTMNLYKFNVSLITFICSFYKRRKIHVKQTDLSTVCRCNDLGGVGEDTLLQCGIELRMTLKT